jgi:hypothetical protein
MPLAACRRGAEQLASALDGAIAGDPSLDPDLVDPGPAPLREAADAVAGRHDLLEVGPERVERQVLERLLGDGVRRLDAE